MWRLLFLLPVLLFSCSSGPTAEELLKQTSALEEAIKVNPNASTEEIVQLVESYLAYANHPGSDADKAVDYLLKAGDMSTRLKDYGQTLSYYETILTKYPDHNDQTK